LFFLGIFIAVPSLLLYLIIPLIIANLFFGFVNEQKSIFVNIILLILYPFLFIVLIEYLVTILGTIISFIHLFLPLIKFFRKETDLSKTKKAIKKK
tara:strand:- start:1417 stop:1704 length:288 start_codon:yes stop_codon:yes gene_type:complete